MVPVSKHDGEFLVVLVRIDLLLWVDDERGTEAVCVGAAVVGVDPIGTPLAGLIDGDDIGHRVTRWNTAVGMSVTC